MPKNRIFQIFLGAEDGEKIANLLGENRKFEKKNILSRICSCLGFVLSRFGPV